MLITADNISKEDFDDKNLQKKCNVYISIVIIAFHFQFIFRVWLPGAFLALGCFLSIGIVNKLDDAEQPVDSTISDLREVIIADAAVTMALTILNGFVCLFVYLRYASVLRNLLCYGYAHVRNETERDVNRRAPTNDQLENGCMQNQLLKQTHLQQQIIHQQQQLQQLQQQQQQQQLQQVHHQVPPAPPRSGYEPDGYETLPNVPAPSYDQATNA